MDESIQKAAVLLAKFQPPGRMVIERAMTGDLLSAAEALMKNDMLKAERDALAAENKRLREALQLVDAWSDQLDDVDRTALRRIVREALSLQPPTASPSAPEGVSGDSEPKP